MNWIELTSEEQLKAIKQKSLEKPQAIFKHSTRCSISSVVKNRLDKAANAEDVDFYYLDLIKYRNISNQVAETFLIQHESPQILLIKNGQCVYNESHSSIRFDDILEQLS